MRDVIIASFATEMSSNEITKDLKEKDYKICQRTVEQMCNNLNIYQLLFFINLNPDQKKSWEHIFR